MLWRNVPLLKCFQVCCEPFGSHLVTLYLIRFNFLALLRRAWDAKMSLPVMTVMLCIRQIEDLDKQH